MEPSVLETLLPLIIVQIPFGIMTICMAKRKGKGAFWWKAIGFVPLIGYFAFLYLIGITDRSVYEKLTAIEEALKTQRT